MQRLLLLFGLILFLHGQLNAQEMVFPIYISYEGKGGLGPLFVVELKNAVRKVGNIVITDDMESALFHVSWKLIFRLEALD